MARQYCAECSAIHNTQKRPEKDCCIDCSLLNDKQDQILPARTRVQRKSQTNAKRKPESSLPQEPAAKRCRKRTPARKRKAQAPKLMIVSSKKRKAQNQAERRTAQTEEQRKRRLVIQRQLNAGKRSDENERQKQKRLAAMRRVTTSQRTNETDQEKQQRLAAMRKFTGTQIANETEDERQQRLAAKRLCTESQMSKETDEERQQRLAAKRQYTESQIANETEDERQQRLAAMRLCTESQMSKETDEERQQRLAAKRQYTESQIANETEDERQQRLAAKRQYTASQIASESQNQRQTRLNAMSVFTESQRRLETTEQKDNRLRTAASNNDVRRRSRSPEGIRHEHRLQQIRMQQFRIERRHKTSSSHCSYCAVSLDEFKESIIEKCHELSRMTTPCYKCGALMWSEERLRYNPIVKVDCSRYKFGMCCKSGKTKIAPIKPPPQYLLDLFTGQDADSKYFFKNIRLINSLLAFASMRCNEADLPAGPGPPVVIMQGTIYHVIGSLLPPNAEKVNFMSLYIYDPDMELVNRLKHVTFQHPAMTRIVQKLQNMLHTCNKLVSMFKTGAETLKEQPESKGMRLVLSSASVNADSHPGTYNTPTTNEIAAVFPLSDTNPRVTLEAQQIVLQLKGGGLKYLPATHSFYHALYYVLFMPHADLGWSLKYKDRGISKNKRISLRDFSAHRLMFRPQGTTAQHFSSATTALEYFPILQYGRRMFQAYIVDEAVRIEDDRLKWIYLNQSTIRADLYQGLADALEADDVLNAGRRKILPSSFTNGPRCKHQHYQDGLAAMINLGVPSAFLTLTCNPNWPEIGAELLPGQRACDRPDLVTRVFYLKLKHLMWQLKRRDILGKMIAYHSAVEFQKRGLPHCHILVTLTDDDRPKCADDYDRFVSAEIPSQDNPRLRALVLRHMIHGPCGVHNTKSPCMVDGTCSKGFPKPFRRSTIDEQDAYPQYRRLAPGQGGETAMLFEATERQFIVDNSWVVPFNPALLLLLESHLNIEIVTSTGCMKYLCKYINKGEDRTSMSVQRENISESDTKLNPNATVANVEPEVVDEITRYQDARYISPPEGCWKILGFPMQDHEPPVDRLPVHLENQQYVTFDAKDNRSAQAALDRHRETKLTAWFKLNIFEQDHPITTKQQQMGPPACDLRYMDIPKFYTWQAKSKCWKRRKLFQEWPVIGRIYVVHPQEGERYFLRRLLHHVRGAKSFDAIKQWDGQSSENELEVCPTYKAVCVRIGLLQDDSEWQICLTEAAVHKKPAQLRRLFSSIMIYCGVQNPISLWKFFKNELCTDVLARCRHEAQNQQLSLNEEMENEVLRKINVILIAMNDSSNLETIGLPVPPQEIEASSLYMNKVADAKNYDKKQLRASAAESYSKLMPEQKIVYDKVMQAVTEFCTSSAFADRKVNGQSAFFVQAAAGTGKTFLMNTLIDAVRAKGEIVLPVASSGLAALLLNDGRTAHSCFKIPIKIKPNSSCYIRMRNDATLELIKRTSLIIWDEAPMQQRYVMEAVDRTLREVRQCDKIFGGIPFLSGGDFQQTLPVIPRASRAQILDKCISNSKLWKQITKLLLKKNMRVYLRSATSAERKEAERFTEILDHIGHGTVPVHKQRGADVIQLDKEFITNSDNIVDFIEEIYPLIQNRFREKNYLQRRAILSPKNVVVDILNDLIREKLPGLTHPYLSADSLGDEDDPLRFPPELLNSLTPSGLPPHKLCLKIGVPIILMRNIDASVGACNGTRLIVTEMHSHVIEAEIMTGKHIGTTVFIQRMPMEPSNDKMGFSMWRLQFPVRLAFVMTINKSQGQGFQKVGIYLPKSVFTHGQLYVALSRSGASKDISLFIENTASREHCMRTSEGTFTKNVVFREVFH